MKCTECGQENKILYMKMVEISYESDPFNYLLNLGSPEVYGPTCLNCLLKNEIRRS